jgi:hypothetical protein
VETPREREVEYRPKPSTIWTGLVMALLGFIPILAAIAIWAAGEAKTDANKAVILILSGTLFCLGCYGARMMLKGINSSVTLREDGITGRNIWGREVLAGWSEVKRVRAFTVAGDDSDTTLLAQPLDVYMVTTDRGNIYFDSTFPGHEELDREIRLRSGTESEGMSWLEALFMTRSTPFNLIVMTACGVAAIVVTNT